MKIIIEEYQYEAADVRDVLQGISSLENIEGKVNVDYVGYYYNPQLKDCVFILPKVLLEVVRTVDGKEEELVFGKYSPKDLINLDDSSFTDVRKRDFIYEFSVWIYRSIKVYQQMNPDSGIVLHKQNAEVGQAKKRLSNTLLDILIALVNFSRDNQQFLFFILRNIHSGFNKINWTRTIAHTSAIIQDSSAVYLNPVNKKRQINFDEELLVIYYSILNYINEHYGFDTDININYELIKGHKFMMYLNGYGAIRLRQIKYRYFSDKALKLWNLCYAFFDKARKVIIDITQQDYLLVKDFNIVFEAIIDDLVGDPRSEIPEGLKDQPDGKRIDHLFTEQGLITHEEDKPVYYIGDSKYYKQGTPVGKNSVYKQFTYARNVIQWNLNLFMNEDNTDEAWQYDKRKFGHFKLRDDITEGYNVIPNFFISSMLNKELDYKDDIELTSKKEKYFMSAQFENRLFDRDTLLVCHYDVNFLFVVSLYARNNRFEKKEWKKKVRKIFREEIQRMLSAHYEFNVMTAHPGVNAEEFIKGHFQQLLGKIFTPYRDKDVYSLALDFKDEKNNKILKDWLSDFFYIIPCKLGEDPEKLIPTAAQRATFVDRSSQIVSALTVAINKGGPSYDFFSEHVARYYNIKDIPQHINMMNIKYLLPVVDGKIDGYYPVQGLNFLNKKDAIQFRLGTHVQFGDAWRKVSSTEIRIGSLVSIGECKKIYNKL